MSMVGNQRLFEWNLPIDHQGNAASLDRVIVSYQYEVVNKTPHQCPIQQIDACLIRTWKSDMLTQKAMGEIRDTRLSTLANDNLVTRELGNFYSR